MTWVKRWGPAILIMLVIFLISGTPGTDLPDFGGWDLLTKKGGHVLGYALLAVAYCYAVNNDKRPKGLQVVLAALMTVLYALSDEWHQRFVPGRNSSLIDVCIDTAGGLMGVSAYWLVRKRVRRMDPTPDTHPK